VLSGVYWAHSTVKCGARSETDQYERRLTCSKLLSSVLANPEKKFKMKKPTNNETILLAKSSKDNAYKYDHIIDEATNAA